MVLVLKMTCQNYKIKVLYISIINKIIKDMLVVLLKNNKNVNIIKKENNNKNKQNNYNLIIMVQYYQTSHGSHGLINYLCIYCEI